MATNPRKAQTDGSTAVQARVDGVDWTYPPAEHRLADARGRLI
jgi:hypothetical protein